MDFLINYFGVKLDMDLEKMICRSVDVNSKSINLPKKFKECTEQTYFVRFDIRNRVY